MLIKKAQCWVVFPISYKFLFSVSQFTSNAPPINVLKVRNVFFLIDEISSLFCRRVNVRNGL